MYLEGPIRCDCDSLGVWGSNVLISLLPGFRDFRTPFVTGSLYLFAAWLLCGDEHLIPSAVEADELGQRVSDLRVLFGAGTAIGALALTAQLLGSLLEIDMATFIKYQLLLRQTRSKIHVHTQSRVTDRIRARFAKPYWARGEEVPRRYVLRGAIPHYDAPNIVASVHEWLLELLAQKENDPGKLHGLVVSRKFGDTYNSMAYNVGRVKGDGNHAVTIVHTLEIILLRKFPILVASLVENAPATYQEYDRFRSEAELRFSVTPPLAIIFVAATWLSASFLWLLGFAGLFLLWRKALRLRTTANEFVWQALIAGHISSPEIDALKSLDTSDVVVPGSQTVNEGAPTSEPEK